HGAPYTRRAQMGLGPPVAGSSIGTPGTLADWFRRRKVIRLPLIFHSCELLTGALLLAMIIRTPLLLGLVTCYALHITLVLIRHHHEFRSRFFYVLIYRLRVGFRRDRLIKPEFL